MIKPIVVYGNSILRQTAQLMKMGSNVKDTLQNMWDTMYNAEGAGLAAPQINLSTRMFIIDLPDQEWKQVFINPVIETRSGEKVIYEEGCLSLPNLTGLVEREDEISVHYFDEDWKFHAEHYSGIKSRVIQHEYDHLEGRLWIDYIDPSVGMKILKHLEDIQERNVVVSYRII